MAAALCTSIALAALEDMGDSISQKCMSAATSACAGAMSMAAGEYISVASQRDTEQADINKEIAAQRCGPESRRYLFLLLCTWRLLRTVLTSIHRLASQKLCVT